MKRPYNKKDSIVAMIPARMGSTRLAMKNLAILNGKPLIYYAIRAARDSGVFSRIVVNSEDPLFAKIAGRYGVDYYRRPAEWATSDARSDSVVYDFIKNNPCDIVAWVNTISPLQTGEDIRGVVGYFVREGLDSLITVKAEQVHCIYKGRPVNFDMKEMFARTQDLVPVQPFVYSVMMWRSGVFMKEFEKKGYAFFCGKTGYYTTGKLPDVIIKTKEDLALAEYILKSSGKGRFRVSYDKLAEERKRRGS